MHAWVAEQVEQIRVRCGRCGCAKFEIFARGAHYVAVCANCSSERVI